MKLAATLFLIAGVLFGPGTAIAQSWPQEPTTVLGIKLGKPWGDSQIPLCPAFDVKTYMTPKAMCVHNRAYSANDDYLIMGETLPFASGVTVQFTDGFVSSVMIGVRQSLYNTLRATFIEKYGRPHQIENNTVKNAAGASLNSEVLTWTGPNTSIVVFERYERSIGVAL